MTLTIIRGIPGSGKSTYAKRNFNCCILENDQFQIYDGKYQWSQEGIRRSIALVQSLAQQILESGCDVCICNTFTKKRYIDVYKRIAESCGAAFKVVRCTGNFKNIHNVPENVMESMKKTFEDYPGEIIN